MTSPEHDFRTQILSGTEHERWQLAAREDLPEFAYRMLLEAGEASVVSSLAQNPKCPPDVLDDIVREASGDLSMQARLNPNAFPDTKDPSPAGQHSTLSIDRYLTDRSATLEQRASFARKHRESPVFGGPLIRDLWSEVISSK
ncbi:hypothetical protein [Microbacterium sp. NPDC091676]|uniref:hypothetical protein n=1 Tax=Microbacterium sp. NPDC091676 TaxID=3364212 RepID=UPI0037FDA782